MQQSSELKDKIQEIYQSDLDWWLRIEDYIWNIWYVLSHREDILRWWNVTPEYILLLEKEYKQVVSIILELSTQDIIDKLNDNKPSKAWTNSNIESIKEAFWINNTI